MRRSNPLLAVFLMAFTSAVSFAQEAGEQDELDSILTLLNQQTNLARESKINADYLPGIISIIRGEEMQKRGFLTLWDALASIPGVQQSLSSTGMRSLSIRGVGDIFEPSKIKLLLNDKALNVSASVTTGAIYDMPVQQIERIELIRGPGSATFGEFAFAGVLNVITRQNNDHYSYGIESGEGYQLTSSSYFKPFNNETTVNFNLAVRDSEGIDITATDSSPSSIRTYSPGQINNKRNLISAILDLQTTDFNAGLQIQQSNRGDYYGVNNLLPPDKKQTVISDTVISLYFEQQIALDKDTTIGWSLNGLQNSLERNALFLGSAESFGGQFNQPDVLADSLIEERRLEANLNAQVKKNNHNLFAQISLVHINVNQAERFLTLDPSTSLPTNTFYEFSPLVTPKQSRRSVSLIFEDEYSFSTDLSITSGIRYDHYNELDDSLSPRVALVWRQSPENIFKAQLARAFRPPSLVEREGSIAAKVNSEQIETLEFGYIYSTVDTVFRNTLYYSIVTDPIIFQNSAPFGYFNGSEQKLYGAEFELEQSITSSLDIQTSLVFQQSDSKLSSATVPQAAKFGAQYEFTDYFMLGIQMYHQSSQPRSKTDPRNNYRKKTTLNLSGNLAHLAGKTGFGLRFGINNLLAEDITFIAGEDGYSEDYLYSDSRYYWVQLSYTP